MRASPLRLLVLLALGPAALSAAPGGRHVLAGQGELTLAETGGAVRVESGSRALALVLPAKTTLEAIAGDAAAWTVAGTRLLPGAQGSELVVARGDDRTAKLLRPPAGRKGRERAAPRLLLKDGALAGLVWLEGRDRGHYAVRAAVYDGQRWSAPETVSPEAPGSQLAPAVARLADGTWIAVWSRFNGHDDDVVWSVRRAGGWSAPQAVHAANAVPDITPSVVASGRGALLAWNHFDGSDYRLELGRFDAGAITALGTLGGPGWIFPELAQAAAGDGALLRCLQADPESWVVLDLDGAAHLRRIASTAVDAARGRPLLRSAGDGGVVVTWTGDGDGQTLPWRLVP